MTDDIRNSLKRFQQLKPALDKAADDAAESVRHGEKVLAELKLEIPATVFVKQISTDTEFARLVYRRCTTGVMAPMLRVKPFRIMISFDDGHAVIREKPWLECSRDEKIASFPQLPQLLKLLIQKAEESIKALNEANSAVKNTLLSMQ
jgi:hypothetical protein